MKTILITGATSGIGLASAKQLAQNNKLILLARRSYKLEELKKSLGTPVYTAAVDITDSSQVTSFFRLLPKEYADIDVLVNSAGLALGAEPAQDSNIDNWETMVDTNIKGLLRVTKPVIDIMQKRRTGQVVNIGSVASFMPYRGGNVYGATKAFVHQFSRNLRTDLLGTGIKVTNIEPGATETEFSVVRFKDKQRADDYYKGWRPLIADNVANAVVWAISQPVHVNIDNVEIMPLDQTSAGVALDKR